MDKFKVIIVEDVLLELKGTEGILRNEVPEAEIVATADSEESFWREYGKERPDLVLLDLGLGGSTTVGVEICRKLKSESPEVKVLIFTGEILNEQLWVEALDAKCDGIILKTGELLTRDDVKSVMNGLEKKQNELIQKLFPNGNGGMGVNATRLVVRAFELHILSLENLCADEE